MGDRSFGPERKLIRHPEARAQRASNGDGLGRASFEARLAARTSG